MKYLFKKIVKTLGKFIIWLFFSTFILFFNGVSTDSNNLFFYIAMILGLIFTFIVIGGIKLKNKKNKRLYIDSNNFEKVGFFKEIFCILKTKDYIFDVIGFMVLVTPLMIYIAVTTNGPIMPRIMATILCILIPTFLYAMLNIIVIFVVRKLWYRGY